MTSILLILTIVWFLNNWFWSKVLMIKYLKLLIFLLKIFLVSIVLEKIYIGAMSKIPIPNISIFFFIIIGFLISSILLLCIEKVHFKSTQVIIILFCSLVFLSFSLIDLRIFNFYSLMLVFYLLKFISINCCKKINYE